MYIKYLAYDTVIQQMMTVIVFAVVIVLTKAMAVKWSAELNISSGKDWSIWKSLFQTNASSLTLEEYFHMLNIAFCFYLL